MDADNNSNRIESRQCHKKQHITEFVNPRNPTDYSTHCRVLNMTFEAERASPTVF